MHPLSLNPHHRAVRRWLAAEYGVKPTLHHGSKHPYLRFTYAGRAHRVTLPGSPSDHRSMRNLRSQIRRDLGPPRLHPVHASVPHLMETAMSDTTFPWINGADLTAKRVDPQPAPQPKPEPPRLLGTAAYYEGRRSLALTFPATIKRYLDPSVTYGLVSHEGSSWEIAAKHGNARLRPLDYGDGWVLALGAGELEMRPFGATPCEYLVIEDRITVSLTEPARPVAVLKKADRPSPRELVRERMRPPPRPEPRPEPNGLLWPGVTAKEPEAPPIPVAPPVAKAPVAPAPAPAIAPGMVDLLRAAPDDERTLRLVLTYLERVQAKTDWRLIETVEGFRWRWCRPDLPPLPKD
jgi:hypothetical protein